METVLTDNSGREMKISNHGNLVIVKLKDQNGYPVIFKGNADEVLQAVKAHHAICKTK